MAGDSPDNRNVSEDNSITRLNHIFEKSAREFGDRLCVQDVYNVYTYHEINEAADRLAATLTDAKIIPGSIIGVFLARGAHVYATILGILKHGSAYLPIDSAFPIERVIFTLSNSVAAALITSLNVVQTAQNRIPCTMILVEDPNASSAMHPLPLPLLPLLQRVSVHTHLNAMWDTLPNQICPTHDPRLCYVIYTSGYE
jgi:non-ribosomal peptide synthetase component F